MNITKSIKSLMLFFIGAMFIFSSYAKTYPIEFFEYRLVENHFCSWTFSQFFSRGLIIVEFILGLFLIFHFKLKKFTLPLAMLLMVAFTVFLIIQYFSLGNEQNCGCFGTKLEFTTTQAIFKNIIIILAILFVWTLEKTMNGNGNLFGFI